MPKYRATLKLPGFKDQTLVEHRIFPARAPSIVSILLAQHAGTAARRSKPAKPLVKAGDHVKMGQKIAEGTDRTTAAVHASVSGTVSGISEVRHAA